MRLIPAQGAACLVFNYPCFEKVFLLTQVHDLRHPWERILRPCELLRQAQLRQAPVGNEVQVLLHHRRIHAQHTGRHGVAGVFDLQLRAFQDHLWAESAQAFIRAAGIDPTFALAIYRAGMSLSFFGDDEAAIRILRQGLPHVDRLPGRWRTIYAALLTWHEGDTHDAFVPLESLVASAPPIPDAYYLLGEIRTHSSRHYDPAKARDRGGSAARTAINGTAPPIRPA